MQAHTSPFLSCSKAKEGKRGSMWLHFDYKSWTIHSAWNSVNLGTRCVQLMKSLPKQNLWWSGDMPIPKWKVVLCLLKAKEFICTLLPVFLWTIFPHDLYVRMLMLTKYFLWEKSIIISFLICEETDSQKNGVPKVRFLWTCCILPQIHQRKYH